MKDKYEKIITLTTELYKENEILKENAKNNDKVVDKVNWENQLLKKENEQLQKELEEYKNQIKYFKYASKNVVDENKKLKDNWNELKEWVNKQYDYYINNKDYIGGRLCFTDMKDKMQELEQGSDNNEI